MTANNNPNHLPKINPANKARGEPKPAAKTHKAENKINTSLKKISLFVLNHKNNLYYF